MLISHIAQHNPAQCAMRLMMPAATSTENLLGSTSSMILVQRQILCYLPTPPCSYLSANLPNISTGYNSHCRDPSSHPATCILQLPRRPT
jgi:hypothetical protein